MNAPVAPHPTDKILHAYGLGKLDDASAESVNAHLEGCSVCRQRVAAMSSDSFLGRLRNANVQAEFVRPAVSSSNGLSMLDGGQATPAPPPESTLPPGLADHPDYQILRELGRGGMGVVYLAHNRLMGRDEVLKVVSRQLIERKGVLERFSREIRSAARLMHPNIVHAYSAFRCGDSVVFAMEYVEGLDLAKLVKTKGPMSVVHASYFAYQTALGLQHAHEQGMVHRDIKPGNQMLSRKGDKAVVKVLDFGLTKATRENPHDAGLTHQGQMLGTPDFIAPEQIRDAQSAGIQADIYSLGCTLYYLLTGKPPFEGDSLYDILQAHHSMEAAPLNLVRPEVPAELAAIVAKMMAKEPGRRFQTPKAVAQALAPFFKPAITQPAVSNAAVARAHAQVTPHHPPAACAAPDPSATIGGTGGWSGQRPPKPRTDGVDWESLVEIKEDETVIDLAKTKRREATAVHADAGGRRPLWNSWQLTIVASVFGLAAIGIVIYITTDRGRIRAELGAGERRGNNKAENLVEHELAAKDRLATNQNDRKFTSAKPTANATPAEGTANAANSDHSDETPPSIFDAVGNADSRAAASLPVQDRWYGATSMIFDNEGRIRAGMARLDFGTDEAGVKRKDFGYGEFFDVNYRINEDIHPSVDLNGVSTIGISYSRRDVAERGSVGILVKSGTLVIRSMVVKD